METTINGRRIMEIKLHGKALVANQKTAAGKNVVMICGCFSTDSDELIEILGDEFNLAIMKLTLNESAIMTEDESITGSPEDFLQFMDTHDWRKVAREGIRTKSIDFVRGF